MSSKKTLKPKRGGVRRGAGRKPHGDEPLTAVIGPVRVTLQQRERWLKLGGGDWLRGELSKTDSLENSE